MTQAMTLPKISEFSWKEATILSLSATSTRKAKRASLRWQRKIPKIFPIPGREKPSIFGSDWKEITYRTEDGTEKRVTIRMGYEIIERMMDREGQFLLVSDIPFPTTGRNTGKRACG